MGGFMEDPLTGDFPTRTAALDEDEIAAQAIVDQYETAPVIDMPGDQQQAISTLVLLLGAGPSLLSQTLFKAAVAFGSVSVPQVQQLRSPYEEEYGPQQHTHVSSLALASGGVAVVASPKELPAEQAVPWAASVLAKLQPVSVLVVVPLPASQYRGPGSPADDDLIFALQTSGATPVAGIPELPCGTLIGGVAAAVLQSCELEERPATVLVAIENAPVPDAGHVCSLADAVHAALGGAAGGLPRGKVLHADVLAAADAMYRSSASSSMFI